ncbi:MAG: hypothetical protein IJ097_03925 [Bacilli bacterium]|nr:hypothetical protein [Bacilli bacterium]
MNFYELIRKIPLEELETLINKKIEILEKKSKEKNDFNYLGYKLDYNPLDYSITSKLDKKNVQIGLRCFCNGYIPKNTKIIYKVKIENNSLSSNDGCYYYLDDDSYILEFCKYIRNKKINDEFTLFQQILEFLNNYFGSFSNVDRDKMFQMILKNDRIYHAPIREHSIKKFKNSGNAMCSEYSVLAQNILSIFDFNTSVVIGQINDKGNIESHAFNLVFYKEKNSEEDVFELIDFANSTDLVDANYKKITDIPYIVDLDDFDDEFLNNFINNEFKIIYHDYVYMLIGDSLLQLGFDKNREYFIGNMLTSNNEVKKLKICYNIFRK